MRKSFVVLFSSLAIFIPIPASAHCPLCTAGAGVAAVAASWWGIGSAPIGVFIGAFAVALGLWLSNLVKKEYIPKQRIFIAVISFVMTVLPIMPMMPGYSSIYISLSGDYGSLLNRTYLINLFLFGAIIGGILVFVAPLISKRLTKLRNDIMFPYQGIAITFSLLAAVALILELLI
jgi:hypothetical protein